MNVAVWIAFFVVIAGSPALPQSNPAGSYLGYDRNDYPGDDNLSLLRQTFAYSGYWLNNPPGANANTWLGKRSKVETAGFGFLVLFNGRTYSELRRSPDAVRLGDSDAKTAANAARGEGFPPEAVIFLDQEEGGRLLPEQKAYLLAWIDGVNQRGFRAGVYCSGMVAHEASGAEIVTADDIRQSAGNRKIVYWVTNDACPPSPGCAVAQLPPSPAASGVNFADVWQFVQSPKRKDVASSCGGYHSDGNCYVGTGQQRQIHLDMNTATSSDPSHGRNH